MNITQSRKKTYKSIYFDGTTFDPVKLGDAWVVLNQSALIDSINQIPDTLHTSLIKTIEKRFISEQK